jgi:hypothetical protein
MSYLGNTPVTQSFISGTDYFNGTGSQTVFTLTRSVASINDIQVTVNNVVQQPNDAYTLSGTTLTMTSAPSAGTNNVYVRYLSTTTQSITPSQNTVGWNQLNIDTQQDLGISFKNRIINGNMVIDQRNAGASVSGNAYPVDRFQVIVSQSSKLTAQQNAGSVTPPAGFTNYLGITSSSAYSVISSDYFAIRQFIEGFNIADLGWGTANAQTVTLSFWVRSSLTGTFGGALQNSAQTRAYPYSYTISAANTWEYKTVTIAGDTTGTWLTNNGQGIGLYFSLGTGSASLGTANAWAASSALAPTGATSVVGTNGATFYITGVQLERGTQATTFTTAGGSYGAELALCQRYFYQLGGINSFTIFAYGVFQASNNAETIINNPVTMRTLPTATYSGSLSDLRLASSANLTPSAIGFDIATPNNLRASLTVSGATGGNACYLRVENSLTPKINVSAEL